MTKGADVLQMLIPNGGWVITGNDYEGIEFLECETITKKQFTDGFAKYDAWKVQQDAVNATKKSDLLNKLGITAEEAALLLS